MKKKFSKRSLLLLGGALLLPVLAYADYSVCVHIAGSVPQYFCPLVPGNVPTCYFFTHDPPMPACWRASSGACDMSGPVIPRIITKLYFAGCSPYTPGIGYCTGWYVGGGGVHDNVPDCGGGQGDGDPNSYPPGGGGGSPGGPGVPWPPQGG